MRNKPIEPIATTRLLLRCIACDDAPAIVKLMTPRVSQWLADWPSPLDLDIARAKLEASLDMARQGNALPLAIFNKATGDCCGCVTIKRDGEYPRRGNLSYWIGEAHQRQYYAREFISPVIAAAFSRLDLDVIEAGAQIENAASFAVMRAGGMQPAGERWVFAPSRNRNELCRFYEIRNPLQTDPKAANLA